MLKIIPFHMDHLNHFNPKNFDGSLEESCAFCLDNPNFRTLASMTTDKDEVVALIGSHVINRDCLEVFLIPSQKMHKYAKQVIKSLRLMIDVLLQNVVRVQIPVLEEHRKWARSLGFEFESVVKKYFGQEDHYMYVKTR
jgi:hypothetical protein